MKLLEAKAQKHGGSPTLPSLPQFLALRIVYTEAPLFLDWGIAFGCSCPALARREVSAPEIWPVSACVSL